MTLEETLNAVREYRDRCSNRNSENHTSEGIEINPHMLAWVEYWLTWMSEKLVFEAPIVDGWISVKDRLPPEGKAVIGYTPVDGCMFVGFYKTYRYSWQDTSVSYWYILTARGSTKTITKRVSHWMPLPEPPEENKHAE